MFATNGPNVYSMHHYRLSDDTNISVSFIKELMSMTQINDMIHDRCVHIVI